MATWDGSEQPGGGGAPTSDDSNYYMFDNGSNTGSNSRTWDYYQNPTNGGYPSHGSLGIYTPNNIPSVSQGFQNTSYQEHNWTPIVDTNTSIANDRSCFFENNRQMRKVASFGSPRYMGQQSENLAHKHSNLHPGASEFIPTAKNLQKIQNTDVLYSTIDSSYNDINATENSQGSRVFFSDNRNRSNDQRYDNTKNSNNSYRGNYKGENYKGQQRSRGYEQPYNPPRNNDETLIAQEAPMNNYQSDENVYRGSKPQRSRNNGSRFQNDRYSNQNRQQYDKSRSDRRKMPIDSWQNSGDIAKEHSMVKEEDDQQQQRSRENTNHSSNYGGRGKWTRNDRRFQNDRYQGNAKLHSTTNDYDDQSSCYDSQISGNSLIASRKDISIRGRGKVQRDAYYDDERTVKFDRNRDDSRDDESQHNWRQKDKIPTRELLPKKNNKKIEFVDDASQRERLTEQLNQGRLECLICCEYIRQNDSVWSCNNCYHVLHLKCLKKWAHSSQGENGWRCPACQNVSLTVPEIYYCFCEKSRAPEWNRRDVAHSCGEICGRLRSKNSCVHKCTLLCHPGSCPECIAMVTRHCGCGRTSQSLKCSTTTLIVCDAICDKTLNCNIHNCENKCHHGDCGICDKTFHQECHCGKHQRDVTCTADLPSSYNCEEICDKLLACGNHRCKEFCHPDSCGTCILQPNLVTHCSCGQTPLTVVRQNCLDPIPTCEKICSKKLKCGQPGDPHTCKIDCHPDECPECELTTKVRCRCGNMDREISCKELRTKADDARCEKKCTKKRSCGKHKCNQLCCIDIEHICPMPCSKTLNCGRHRCQLCCHKGRCQPCQQMSFDELHCECGASVIYPPVACGTRRPTCNRPCTRQHVCGHEVLHNCHSDPTCPPCTVLTQKWCYGKHELRKAVPCHVNEISCGLPCGKPISCGRHKCIALCHSGACEKPGQICTQSCTTPRELCGHICAASCHDLKCPDIPCKEMVKVTCNCGHRSTTRACAENSRDFQKIASGILASKMADMQLGHSVDLEEVFGQGAKKLNQLKTLECNDECKIIARNTRIALGLQIVNPDVSGKLMPRYTESMKQWAKKDPHFCQMVHDRLTELVHLAKASKQKSRSYSFDSMNRDKRNFVHESCDHFGCESQAYDREPKRNVVATAVKDKCWLPAYSLLEIVQRENGQRKVPRPMLNSSKPNSTLRLSEVLSSTARASQKLQPSVSSSSSKSPEPEIDYFDFPNGKTTNKWSNV